MISGAILTSVIPGRITTMYQLVLSGNEMKNEIARIKTIQYPRLRPNCLLRSLPQALPYPIRNNR
jgi:hypothetical protein